MKVLRNKNIKIVRIFLAMMTLIHFPLGCDSKVNNEDKPNFQGQIINIDEGREKILIEYSDTRIWLSIKNHTEIYKEKDKGSFSDFQIGNKVEVWLDESYLILDTKPPIAVAKKVVITNKF